MAAVYGDQKYPVFAYHIFTNLTLIDKFGRILLVLNEDRLSKKIYVPPGGEVEFYKEQILHEAVIAEVKEEVGLEIDPQKLLLVGEPQIILPTKEYNPYPAKDVEGGAGIIVFSYVYTGRRDFGKIKINTVPEKNCNVVEYAWVDFPISMMDIEILKELGINLYPNYVEKLFELHRMFRSMERIL